MNISSENMREPARLGGMSTNRLASRGNYAPRDSGPLPVFVPKSILPDATLPISQLSQAPLHKSTVLIDGLAGVLLGVGFVIVGFILLFVHIPSPL
jgi:hypothetical protein